MGTRSWQDGFKQGRLAESYIQYRIDGHPYDGLPSELKVAQAGGWKNTATLATIYQQPDEATLYAVVSQPAELRERQA